MLKNTIKIAANLLFLLLFVVLLKEFASVEQTLTVLQQIPVSYLITGILALCSTYLLRAHRFYLLLVDHRISWLSVLKIMLQHNAINNVLPFRLGELSFPVLLKKNAGIGFQDSLKVLLTVRLFDLAVMSAIAFIVLNSILLKLKPAWILPEFLLIALAVSAILLMIKTGKLPFISALIAYVGYIKQHFRKVGATSVFIWLLKTLGQALLLTPMLQTLWSYAVLAVLVIEGTAILPVNGPLNFGSLEGASIAVLAPLGLEASAVLAAVLNLHLAIIMLAALGYVLSLLIPSSTQKEVSP